MKTTFRSLRSGTLTLLLWRAGGRAQPSLPRAGATRVAAGLRGKSNGTQLVAARPAGFFAGGSPTWAATLLLDSFSCAFLLFSSIRDSCSADMFSNGPIYIYISCTLLTKSLSTGQ